MRAIRPRTRGAADENIVTIDTDSAPRIMFYGEDFLCEDLPVGTRVIYPRRPIAGLPNPRAAIRYALNHPEDLEPLHALLDAGHEGHDRRRRHLAAAAADDARPTCARRSSRSCCEMLADHGVDDVHIIIATSLHRRMHDWRDPAHGRRQGLRRLLARSPLQPRRLRSRRHGRARQDRARRARRDQPARRRERPRHLRQHQPRADGRRPQVGGRRAVRLRVAQGAPHAQGDRRVQLVHGSASSSALATRSSASAACATST